MGYIGLVNFDRVSASIFGEGLRQRFPPARGKGAAGQFFNWLETPQAEGVANFTEATRLLALQSRRSGLAMVVSDFLFPEGYQTGLKTLAARGFETTCIQLLAREELEPTLRGDLKLVDAEDGSIREVTVSAPLLKTYKANLDAYTSELRAFCLRYGMNYVLVGNDTPVEEVVGRMLRGAGVVK